MADVKIPRRQTKDSPRINPASQISHALSVMPLDEGT